MSGHEERCLAEAVHDGEPGALERLVEIHQDGLYGYALRLLGNDSDAREAVQDALLRAWQTLVSRYDESRCRSLALRPWLYRITRNGALNRRRSRRRELPVESAEEPAAPEAHDFERDDALERAIGKLPGTERELIALRFYEELPYAEIAVVVGRTEAAVRGGVFRALRRLRGILKEMGCLHAM